ncbi:MAG TPA: DUF1289 domain-containing protein [Burkholderiales bacterium]|nr:DUF1289 domain-containing protein [Burkholderiales bacterium]
MPVPSTPCQKICVLDPLSCLCIACGRTAEEIAAWPALSEAERLATMAGLEARLLNARSRKARSGRVAARERG